MRTRLTMVVTAVMLCLPIPRARAQDAVATSQLPTRAPTTPHRAQPTRANEYMLSAWLGLSTSSTAWAPLGAAPDTKLGVLALRLSRRLGAPAERSSTAWWYTVDVIPVAIISPAYISAPRSAGCSRRQVCALPRPDTSSALFPPGSVTGLGLTPLGVTAILRPQHAVQFTLGATAGAMWFTEPVPTTRSSQGNFTATLESGVRFATRCGLAWSLTYRLHHISNAWFGEENPAVGSHLFSIGVDRGRPRGSVNSTSC